MARWVATAAHLLLWVGGAGAVLKIGMSGPLYQDYGKQISAGMKFAFDEVNAAGGIMNQNLSLVAMDDAYNTTKTMENIVSLVDQVGVVALAGVVGSDVVTLSRDFVLQRRIPYVGAYSGIAALKSPFYPEYVNVRLSYADEMVAHALYLVQYGMLQRFACFYQNDSFGTSGCQALSNALANVGITLVASGEYVKGTTDVAAAVNAIAGAAQPAQVVVLVGVQDAITSFIQAYANDSRTDPGCVFTVVSSGWGSSFVTALDKKYWDRVYFFFAVPLPGDPSSVLATQFATAYSAAGLVPDPLALEGYVTGRLIAQAFTATHNPNPTSSMFLDAVYNTRMFVLDDLVVGLYSGNWTGCSVVLCSCNAGLREVHLAQLDPALGGLGPPLASLRYAITDCSNPVSSVKAPLLFGQLLPSWDAGWYRVALDIGQGVAQAFAEVNAKGGANDRAFTLLQQNYSTNATNAIAALARRYPLIGLLGSVAPDTATVSTPLPVIGDLDMQPDAQDAPFNRSKIALQPSTTLELMALAQFAVAQGCAIHLRAPNAGNGAALLSVMTQSVNSFQQKPTSAALYSPGNDLLASVQSGCLLALGSDADVLSWYTALAAYPDLHVLTLSANTLRTMAMFPNASSLAQASRWHFPTIITGRWNTTVTTDPSEGWKYGYVLGTAAMQAIQHSEYVSNSYTTAAQLVTAWYAVIVMTSGTVSFGPYYGDTCSAGKTECECNQGTRSLAVRNAASSAVESLYSMSTCHVVYTPFIEDGSMSTGAIVGAAVGGTAAAGVILVGLWKCGRRNNHEAPKDSNKPFCVLFTDIQSSTHLWATIPDVMAHALDRHHELIRKLIAKHKCYEVKTIGDSFMCAAHAPRQAVEMSLAIQCVFFEFDWGTEAINAVYRESIPAGEEEEGRYSRACWNGLRVRVGIHYGQGDVKLDPVSKGYDYYGTVVNTAARIESVCHGGQIGVSQAVSDAVGGDLPGSVWSDLGRHELRGLSEPIRLYQILPDGPYSQRTFPPLRLEKEDQIHEALQASEEVVVVTQRSGSTKGGGGDGGNRGSLSTVAENWKWVEMHPLVMRGDITAEILRKHYLVALTTLSTLLNTQTAKFKETVVQGLCERLHVPNHGVAGVQLQHTLKGLVQRVLPATVLAVQGCGNSTNNFSCDRLSSCLVTGIDANSLGGSFRAIRVQGAPVLNAESP